MRAFINKDSEVLIQGITGNEGQKACEDMLAYGTKVVAGVSPGKDGEEVCGVPVYGAVSDARKKHPQINVSLVSVPAKFATSAALEAIEAGIQNVVIFTEHIPVQDCARIIAKAKKKNIRVIGPSSVGILIPGEVKVGSVGRGDIERVFTKGDVAVISKSGGMSSETSNVLTRAGIGQSVVVGIGGDPLIGTSFKDMIEILRDHEETKKVVLFCEIGGFYEEELAEYIRESKFSKPVVAVVAGAFSEDLEEGTVLGHAGAIVSKGRGGYRSKVDAFESAGIVVATSLDDVPRLLAEM